MVATDTMVKLPETKSKSSGGGSSKRSPSKTSMSLPGNKKQKLHHAPDKALASSVPLKSQGSGSDQNASEWFDNVNQHVSQSVEANAAYDDEPPFFMTNQNLYRPPQFGVSESSGRIFGPSNSRLDSENEDLRGVIDDLTVENKKLRHILRSHQSHRASPSTESQDKLFEVRMHGLPPEKRRELEYLLKNFATSVHTTAPSLAQSNSGSGVSSTSLPGNKPKTDSGYVSNSNSGQTSKGRKQTVGPSQRANEKSVKNYLHDIPDTLLPRQHPLVMSERAKMALVVRRLEQLFTGKNAAPGEHSQPLQQQEVSQMAARADANGTKRRAEGTREAHILPSDFKINFDALDPSPEKRSQTLPKSASIDSTITEGDQHVISRPGSPDQRPTRPLDLDIHRAQVASDNIQYIRHLGLSSPRLNAGGELKETSWMYLNLLVNMAQVHTINVTPHFIQQAIRKLSTKFEISKDGNRVRWIGGSEGTQFSKEEEKALETADHNNASPHESTEDSGTGESSKRSKTDSTSNAVVSNTTSSEDKTSGLNTHSGSKHQRSTEATSNEQLSNVPPLTRTGSSFDYKPLIYREKPGVADDQYLQDSDSSHDTLSRDSSGLAHALSKSNLSQQRHSDEGLITFYNNPHFCSDFSGDRTPNNILKDRLVLPGDAIGLPSPDQASESPLRYGNACYFTPQFGPAPYRPAEGESSAVLDLGPISAAGEEETQPIELTCSGLGGVIPDDNFAIDVQVAMVKARPALRRVQATVPFTLTKIESNFIYSIERKHKLSLLPSRLPPANYIFFTSSSSSANPDLDDSDDDGSDESSSTGEDDAPPPLHFMQHWSADGSGDAMDEDADDDADDDSSVDMLAIARQADPARIAEQERQYMINEPGHRVIAGSLAATVGASGSSVGANDTDSNVGVASHMDVDDDGAESMSDED